MGKRLQKHIWRLAFGMLIMAMLSFYLVSFLFARYTSDGGTNDGARVANFSCFASIDDVSALSFTNADFWRHTADGNDVAMNATLYLDFSVWNFEEKNGKTIVSEVALSYDLIFTVPQSFAQNLAIQLFNSQNSALLPHIVLKDLLNTPNGGIFDTAQSMDYNGAAAADVAFAVDITNGVITATAGDTVIRVKSVEKEIMQTAYFRLWDTSVIINPGSSGQSENGDLLAPLKIQFVESVPCYEISIFLNGFELPPSEPTTANYVLTLALTEALSDDCLGGHLIDAATLQEVASVAAGQEIILETIIQTTTDTDENGNVTTNTHTLVGEKKEYVAGRTETEIWVEKDNEPGTYTLTVVETTEESVEADPMYYGANMKVVTSEWRAKYRVDLSYIKKVTTTTVYEISAKRTATIRQSATTNTVSADGNTVDQTVVTNATCQYEVIGGTKTTTTHTEHIDEKYDFYRNDGSFWPTWNKIDSNPGIATTLLPDVDAAPDDSTVTGDVTQEDITALQGKTFDEPETTASRHITHAFFPKTVTISSVSRMDGDTELFYPAGTPFELYNGDVQQYILSPCYSKEYPLFVDVRFEQIT